MTIETLPTFQLIFERKFLLAHHTFSFLNERKSEEKKCFLPQQLVLGKMWITMKLQKHSNNGERTYYRRLLVKSHQGRRDDCTSIWVLRTYTQCHNKLHNQVVKKQIMQLKEEVLFIETKESVRMVRTIEKKINSKEKNVRIARKPLITKSDSTIVQNCWRSYKESTSNC